MEKLFATIDKYADEYKKFLFDITSIESFTSDKEGNDRVLDYMIEHEKANGYILKRAKMEKSGDVASFHYFNGEDLPTFCLSAHTDTVHPTGLFGNPPCRVEGNILYGPGVTDCKGGFAIAFLIMKAFRELGIKSCNLKTITQSDEEVASIFSNKKTLDFMVQEALGARAFFNLEPLNENCATVGRYGIIKATFTITGKAAHAGLKNTGANAIAEAAHKILDIESQPFTDNTSFNVGVINGGTAVNTVPEVCTFSVDCRVKTLNDRETVLNYLNSIAQKTFIEGTKCEMKIISERIPLEENEKTEELFRIVNRTSQKYFNRPLSRIVSRGGADSAYTARAGIPSIDSLGLYGKNIHSIKELGDLDSIATQAKLIAASIMEMMNE